MPPQRQQGDAIPDTERLKELLGDIGVVVTPLRPVGMCDFSGIFCLKLEGFLITVCFHCVAPLLLFNLLFINKLYQKRSFFQLEL